MMEVTFTCEECGSGVHVHPSKDASKIQCSICHHESEVKFDENHEAGILKDCPCCERKDFYSQKDFNRKIGVILFVLAAIGFVVVSTYYGWYGLLCFIGLWLFDVLLFKKLKFIAVCYKCNTIFRNVKNIKDIPGFDHEMNDRIIYSDHDFGGKPLEH